MTETPGSQPPLIDPSQPSTPAQPNTPSAVASPDPSAPQAAPPAVQPFYTMPASSYAQAAYPPPKKGSSTLKIVLIIVGIFVGLGIIVAGFASYAFYKFAKSSNMTASSQPVTAAELGVPPYPGAMQGKSIRMTLAGSNMLTASFVTSDPREQVIQFYKTSLGPDAIDATTFNGESLRLSKGAGETVTVTASDQPGGIGGKTSISIVHITKAAPPSN